jgi:hypothetical protein
MSAFDGWSRQKGGIKMFRDKETWVLEAALLAAVPICVAVTALVAFLTLAGI